VRGLYDHPELGPASGIIEISAIQKLATWLAEGSLTGMPPRVPSVAAAQSPEERRDAAKEWLLGSGGPGDLAERHFVPPSTPGAAGGSFSVITSRSQAAQTPYFRDLAPDVVWATHRLSDLLDQAYTAAVLDSAENVGDDYSAAASALPEGGVF
jgi:hypothetical protein